MSEFKLSLRSRSRLEGADTSIALHPDLRAVVERAIELTPIDFGVNEVGRTMDRQLQLLAQRKTTTLASKHLKQEDGYSHAVDLYVLVGGKATWEHKYFRPVVQAMFTAAIEKGVQIKAGSLWRSFQDSPHFELNGKYYS